MAGKLSSIWMVRTGASAFAVGMVLTQGTPPVYAQAVSSSSGIPYPVKPVRMVTTLPGGGNDFAARLLAQALAAPLGQPVFVENRPSGVVVVDTVAKAPPDGYTILVYSDGLWLLPLMQKVPYDPVRDFAPITHLGGTPQVLAVHPSLPVKSVRELVALAKARPGELNFGASDPSSASNLSGELFKFMAGVNMVAIRYKAAGPLVLGVLSGEVQLIFSTAPSVAAHLKSGRLRGLAVTSAQPSVVVPGLPTLSASGVPGFEAGTSYGIFVPSKTAPAIVSQLHREIVRLLNSPEIRERLLSVGIEVVASSPEQMANLVASEMSRMGKVIRNAGIRFE